MREGRFELPRPFGHRILSPARLPGFATLARSEAYSADSSVDGAVTRTDDALVGRLGGVCVDVVIRLPLAPPQDYLLWLDWWTAAEEIAGARPGADEPDISGDVSLIMRTPLLSGRDFTAQDVEPCYMSVQEPSAAR